MQSLLGALSQHLWSISSLFPCLLAPSWPWADKNLPLFPLVVDSHLLTLGFDASQRSVDSQADCGRRRLRAS